MNSAARPERTSTPRALAIWEWSLIVAAYLVLDARKHWIGADGAIRFQALNDLLEKGQLSSAKTSLIGPMFSAPLWCFGKWVLGKAYVGCAYYNWILFGLAILAFDRLLKDRLAPETRRHFLLLLMAGSMFTYHVQGFYGEVFTALCVALGTLMICFERRAWLGWIAIVLGTANTPAATVGAAAVCLYVVVRTGRLRFLLPLVTVVALIAGESLLRRGALRSGYEGDHGFSSVLPYSGRAGFSYPFALGILGELMSFGKGLVFYAPAVFLPVERLIRDKPDLVLVRRLWLVFLVGLVLVYAKWWAWYGGEYWGPRFLLFASIPASFALALRLDDRSSVVGSAVTLAVLTLSVWVGADGAVFGSRNLEACRQNDYALEHLCWHVPEFAAWVRPFIVAPVLLKREWAFLAVYAVVYVHLALPTAGFLVRSIRTEYWPFFRRVCSRSWKF